MSKRFEVRKDGVRPNSQFKKNGSRISRVLFRRVHCGLYHQSTAAVADGLYQPTPRQRASQPLTVGIFGLSTHKVCHQPASLSAVVSSCLAFSPLPLAGRFVFCGTCCRQDACLPAAFPLGSMVARVARTFLPQHGAAGDRVGCRFSCFLWIEGDFCPPPTIDISYFQ